VFSFMSIRDSSDNNTIIGTGWLKHLTRVLTWTCPICWMIVPLISFQISDLIFYPPFVVFSLILMDISLFDWSELIKLVSGLWKFIYILILF
jgi:hypothetical protein